MFEHLPRPTQAIIIWIITVMAWIAAGTIASVDPLPRPGQLYMPYALFAMGFITGLFGTVETWNYWALVQNYLKDLEKNRELKTPALALAQEIRFMTDQMLEKMPDAKDAYGSIFYGPDGRKRATENVSTPFGFVPLEYVRFYLHRSSRFYGMPISANTGGADAAREQERDWQKAFEELCVYMKWMHPIDRNIKPKNGPYPRATWRPGGYADAVYYYYFESEIKVPGAKYVVEKVEEQGEEQPQVEVSKEAMKESEA